MTLALCMLGRLAWADAYDLFGLGSRAASMGGVSVAVATGPSSVFYNPARLVDEQESNLSFGVRFSTMGAQVKAIDDSRPIECSACRAPDGIGFWVGFSTPFPGKLSRRAALGAALSMPAGVVLRLNAPDANSPYWYRYQSSSERLALNLAVGVKLWDWLQVGAGFGALADFLGDGAAARVDLFTHSVEANAVDSRLGPRVAPIIGLHIAPLESLQLGVTFRGETGLHYVIPAQVELTSLGRLGLSISGVAHYEPNTLVVGLASAGFKSLTLAADLEWQQWSKAPSPYADLTLDLSGPLLSGVGLEEALDAESHFPSPGFQDTLGVRVGAEYRVLPRIDLRLGAFLRPTPIPKQNAAQTNLLDNTAIGISGGIDVAIDDPLEILGRPLHLEASAQNHFILPRQATKPPSDVVPSYSAGASVFGVDLTLSYSF